MTEHLGHERGATPNPGPDAKSNVRNGYSAKTVRTEIGDVRIQVPRDRAGSFEPIMVPKHARHLSGFDQAVISLYAKGMTTADIVNHLQDVYGTSVSKDLVSRVTDAVLEQMQAWADRPLDAVYPVLLIDCIYVKIREGQVSNRPIYVAMGITIDGERDVLGLWAGPAGGGEGARQWLAMLTELKNRGVQDVLIACCDGVRIARKGIDSSQKLGKHRWVIERTIAWAFGYRRLTIRYERYANHFGGFLALAATLTCFKKLTKHYRETY